LGCWSATLWATCSGSCCSSSSCRPVTGVSSLRAVFGGSGRWPASIGAMRCSGPRPGCSRMPCSSCPRSCSPLSTIRPPPACSRWRSASSSCRCVC
jgi:hypothetical protein